jgi:tRNA-splicing ligase RtcB
MKKVYGTNVNRIPIKTWLDDIEPGAMVQAENLSNLPFTFKHIALMPDCHQGYGMPIGGVMATEGVVVPNAVGVDIGCGVITIRTPFTEIFKITEIMSEIRKRIPLGFNKHKKPKDAELMPLQGVISSDQFPIVSQEFENAKKSLGTLGGGNHFIEFQKGSDGHIYIMIHSGSRNLGHKVATHYNKLAKQKNKFWYSSIPVEWDLAYLPLDSEEGQDYMREMQYCVAFAKKNRQEMMQTILDILEEQGHFNFEGGEDSYNNMSKSVIDIAHNYAQMENHFGRDVMVHRKGATLAREGTIGIIPGSQGTKSYIVKGKGNPESFNSCSHGAGRILGRKQAQKKLSLEDEIKKLDDQGILHTIRTEKDLDEASGSYKDIRTVMSNQDDLVDVLIELQPLAVIKG